jgi:cytochrome bd-type quinol oxidase subunit 1
LRNLHFELPKSALFAAAAFGLASSLSVVMLANESGYSVTEHQQMKLAAIEAMRTTESALPSSPYLLCPINRPNRAKAADFPLPCGKASSRPRRSEKMSMAARLPDIEAG